MVLERIYPASWLEKKSYFAFLLGLTYSVIGIGLAVFIFPQSPGIASLAFTSLLLLPSLYRLITIDEIKESSEQRFSWQKLWQDNKNFIKIFLFLMLGIEIAFTLFAIIFPDAALVHIFGEQTAIYKGYTGGIYFTLDLFKHIFLNNIKVLGLCFLLSLMVGDGAIFFLIWNASVWGTVFGTLARSAAANIGGHPLLYYLVIFITVLPHGLLEVLAYILAAIAGGVISRGMMEEGGLTPRMKEILAYNLVILIISIIVLALGGVVETLVLDNAEAYRMIINSAFGV
ncbi:stage II sporulation protein M [Candidatus Woesearchaeota archaeon]|nr:MAG: stage II sporulation protein M [Candidatus Woesearchaeota archaeon]